MADKEYGVSRTRLKEARVERERMARSCVPAHAWSEGSGKKEPRVSDKSDLNYTRPSAYSRPCNSASCRYTRENSIVYAWIYICENRITTRTRRKNPSKLEWKRELTWEFLFYFSNNITTESVENLLQEKIKILKLFYSICHKIIVLSRQHLT